MQPIRRAASLPRGPTGSAMPFAWAHAEFIKLWCRADLGRPSTGRQRYGTLLGVAGRGRNTRSGGRRRRSARWPAGARLVVALPEPATVHWGVDGWHTPTDTPAVDTGLGFYAAPLWRPPNCRPAASIDFTWRKPDTGAWAGRDYGVAVVQAQEAAASFTTLHPASRAANGQRGA